jgi:hypothetical protein
MESIRISTVQYKKYVKRRVAVGAREREREKKKIESVRRFFLIRSVWD